MTKKSYDQENGELTLQRVLGDVEETLEHVGSHFYPIAMEKQIELQLDVDGAVPKIKLDHDRLEHCLSATLIILL